MIMGTFPLRWQSLSMIVGCLPPYIRILTHYDHGISGCRHCCAERLAAKNHSTGVCGQSYCRGVPAEPAASPAGPAVPLRQRLRGALAVAMKARDRVAVTVLRSTLAAIDNAEAVDRSAWTGEGLAIGQIPVGAGAAEVERRVLTEPQVEQIVRAELAEREAAARDYDQAGQRERARQLRSEASFLSEFLADGQTGETSRK
jgi:uncharacterized protein YqeY